MGRLTNLRPAFTVMRPSKVRVAVGREERDRLRSERAWRGWYKLARWRRLRLAVFARDGFTCQWPGCGRLIGNTSRLVADHREPHRGDARLFWDEANLWTLCKPCHDRAKQRAEARGGRGVLG